MSIQVTILELVGPLLAFFAFCGGAGKLLLVQTQRHLDERFTTQDVTRSANHRQLSDRLDAIEEAARDDAAQWKRVERELMELKADLPMRFVMRDDYVRGQSVIEAKLDGLALKIENVQLRGLAGARHVD